MTKHLVFGLVFAIGASPSLRGQVVMGTVVDFQTAAPVPSFPIVLIDSAGNVLERALSDSSGAVSLVAPNAGVFQLRSQRPGWQLTYEPRVALGRTDTLRLDLVIRAVQLELDPIQVTADGPSNVPVGLRAFYARRAQGRGVFLTAEDIEERNPTRIPHALSMIPGVRLYSMDGAHLTVRMITAMGLSGTQGRGDVDSDVPRSNPIPGCPPVVYVDGVPVGNADDSLDSFVFPYEVAGIEVYRRASEMPAEFSGSRSGCGVIVIWTKRGPARDLLLEEVGTA